jgi:hypothetical protein
MVAEASEAGLRRSSPETGRFGRTRGDDRSAGGDRSAVVECRMKPEVLWEGLTKAIRFPLMDCALCGFEVTVASP